MTHPGEIRPQAEPVSPSAEQTIQNAILQLRSLSQLDIQPHWRWSFKDWAIEDLEAAAEPDWAIAPLNERDHIAWAKGRQVMWVRQTIQVPPQLQGYALSGLTLRLALTWWAEVAQIFVNGQLVQEGDLFDCSTRIQLSSAVQPGDSFTVAIRLISPGHDDGALVRSQLLYEVPQASFLPSPEPGFVADELEVLLQYCNTLQPEHLLTLAAAVADLNWDLGDRPSFHHSLAQLRQTLHPLGQWLKQRQMHYVGHAHLDLAWLWPVSETWEAAERTFQSVLKLQQDFRDLIFCHSSPALYAWLEVHRPELFRQIQQQVANGQWEVAAGLWVEPELNLISGESLVRQVLYGQHYVRDRFGAVSAIAWLPDSFGFCWQLPQILKQGRIDYFVTQKLRWNDSTEFPHALFWWRSPDGSEILSLMSPPIGERIDPVKMAHYASTWEQQTHLTQALWLPGVGDHGGGPTRDMLEVAQRWQDSPLFPQLRSTQAVDYLRQIEAQMASPTAAPLPVWQDELYLEFHRGCYTTHADQKRQNRRCETLLYQAELYATLAAQVSSSPYPKTELETAWKQVLFNQFHDILPGSAIPEVFVDANQSWRTAKILGTKILERSLEAIANCITLPPAPHTEAVPVIVFNPSSWARSQLVEIPLPETEGEGDRWHVQDTDGKVLPSQMMELSQQSDRLLVYTPTLASLGYQVLWLVPQAHTSPLAAPDSVSLRDWTIENAFLYVEVNPETGDLQSVYDKVNQREVLSGPGNQLQAFQDQGQYWDAWNIDPHYAEHPLPPSVLLEINCIEQGSLRSAIRVTRRIGHSTFWQTYRLEAGSPLLNITTVVDWQERHVLVKAAFPFTVEADAATYEIPCGAIQRPTQPQTPQDAAKWEVPALHWADLGGSDYGVSVLNDCKYGYDSQPHQLRLTLLRGATWPNPNADLGHHAFTYALYPHAGSWQAARTVHHGYELNQPLLLWQPKQAFSAETGDRAANQPVLPPIGCFLDPGVENWVIMALKLAEDDPEQVILRGYECHGQPAELQLQGFMQLEDPQPVNLLEEAWDHPPAESTWAIAPWRISSYQGKLQFNSAFAKTLDR